MASITGWTRLEPRPRSKDFEKALQARVHDPLWLLARQWQVGEFQGDDAGSAVATRLEYTSSPLNRYHLGPVNPATSGLPYDPQQLPLEPLVECEPIRGAQRLDLRAAAEGGMHFLRLLEGENLTKDYRPGYLDRFPLTLPASMDPATVDPNSQRFLSILQGRAPDGVALAADLRPGLTSNPSRLPNIPKIQPADKARVLAVAQAWLDWWDGAFLEPVEASPTAWASNRMEYQFQVSAQTPTGQELVLSADEYYQGRLDWYAFDLQPGAQLGGEAGPGEVRRVVHNVVPTPIDFEGMPAPRWWEFEDGRVNFGRVEVAQEDLARLLLLDFALIYGNDWLILPVRMEAGTILHIDSLVVTDNFGVQVNIPPSSQPASSSASWGLFYQAVAGQSLTHNLPAVEQVFFLPPSLATSLESAPVEEIRMIRDEMANMAWAIERVVQGVTGRPVDRFEQEQTKQRLQAESPTNEPPVNVRPSIVYRLASSVPEHWIPLVPVHTDASRRAIALQRGAMMNPETNSPILPKGNLLTPGQRLILEDEEVPRSGVQITRSYQYTRWTGGETLLWLGRRKKVGRGEGSSGLRFDLVEPNS